jgi:serine/threonine-protein kinase
MIGHQVGKYQIIDRVGRGGMGTVYRALDSVLQREVAIKVLNAELNDPEIARRFRAEAVTVARLNHPGIATIYELFEHEGQWLMVMEFVRGETLEHMVDRMGPLSAQRAAEFSMQALTALAHAHSMGVVHRDLKPANLMVTENGVVKIMDFGIARVSGSEHLTGVGFMMGTPAYMAPEQVMGHEIDSRADLYSMGVVFYRLTTAKLPFRGETPFAMAHSQVHDPPTPVGMQRSDLPAWVEQLIGRALAKSPEDRFQSAVEFYEAFSRCLAGLPMTTLSGPVIPGPGDPTGMIHTPARMPSGAYGMRTPLGMPSGLSPAMTPSGMSPAMTSDMNPLMHAPTPPMPMAALSTDVTRQVETPGPISARAKTSAAPKPKTKTKSPIPVTPVTIGVAAAVVVLLAVGGFLLFGRGSDAAPPAQPDVAVVPPPPPDPALVTPPAETTPVSDPALAPQTPPVAAATPSQPATPVPPPPQTPPQGSARTGQAANTSARANAPPRGTGDAARGTAGQPPVTSGVTAGAATTAASTTGATAPASGTPPPTPSPPAPPAVADTPVTFDDLKVVTVTGQKSTEQDGVLKFGDGAIAISARRGGETLATLAYPAITRATYVRGKNPQFDAALPAPPADFDPPPGLFGYPNRHWLVLQTRSAYSIVHLDNNDVVKVLDTIEKRTGVRVVRK